MKKSKFISFQVKRFRSLTDVTLDISQDLPTIVANILNNFRFIFIESHNVNLPSLIATILEKDGLLSLDTKRTKQSAPLNKLKEFIELSQKAISY